MAQQPQGDYAGVSGTLRKALGGFCFALAEPLR